MSGSYSHCVQLFEEQLFPQWLQHPTCLPARYGDSDLSTPSPALGEANHLNEHLALKRVDVVLSTLHRLEHRKTQLRR